MEKEIGLKLKALREKRNLEPLNVAEHLHIDVSTLRKMESGTYSSWNKYLFDLLSLYKATPQEFFCDIAGKKFVRQEIKENKDNSLIMEAQHIEKNYADKTIVKSLFNEKDKRIELLEDKLKHVKIEIDQLRIENAYLKGKIGNSV
jgi:transcriptional regulator with XRE-family HTH domain